MKLIRPISVLDAVLTSSNVAETDCAAYNPATTYALGDHAIVVAADVHKVYESLQAANTGHTPASSPTWWLDVGATNRWKMFDGSLASQTSNANSIAVTLAAPGRADSVALLNVSAASVQITMTDAVDGLVYDQTVNLISDSGIIDWYAYFFEPIIRATDITVTDLPPYSDTSIAVTLTDTGANAKCGECVVGFSREIGSTKWGASVGIQDYSIKQQDAFGNYTVLERGFSKRGRFVLEIQTGQVDAIQALLASYRATPIVYAGLDGYGATIIYGFYKDFSVDIAYLRYSVISIEIEGLA